MERPVRVDIIVCISNACKENYNGQVKKQEKSKFMKLENLLYFFLWKLHISENETIFRGLNYANLFVFLKENVLNPIVTADGGHQPVN